MSLKNLADCKKNIKKVDGILLSCKNRVIDIVSNLEVTSDSVIGGCSLS
jgi:hypothetical protein